MTEMAENDQKEKVNPFAIYVALVAEFVANLVKAKSAQKVANALRSAEKVLSDEKLTEVGNVRLADIQAALGDLDKITASVSGEMRETLQKSTLFVEQALETDIVPAADVEAAKAATEAFRANSITNLAPVGKARARQTA